MTALSSSTRRQLLGQWFTPTPVIDLALALLGTIPDDARILDPACGDGAMLARCLERGLRHVCGVEIDPAAAALARARLRGDPRFTDAGEILPGDLLDAAVVGDRRFDMVLANPPWVSAHVASAEQKRARADALARDWPTMAAADRATLARHGDLAVHCLFRALAVTRSGGRLALVLSSSLLDADYADAMWRALGEIAHVGAVVTAPGERWFGEAAVNAMICVLQRRAGSARIATRAIEPDAFTQVARLSLPTELASARLAATTPLAGDSPLAVSPSLAAVAEIRRVPAVAHARALATALRAPQTWLDFAAAAGPALVRLGDLAAIRRGATTGANAFFYLSRAEATRLGIEPAVLSPVVRSPFNGAPTRIAIDPTATPLVAITAPAGTDLRALPGLARWIAANASLADRPSVRRRAPWWSMDMTCGRLFVAKAYGPRFVQRLAPAPMVADQRVSALSPLPGVDLLALTAVLNGVATALALESLGRASMGNGALEWTARDLADLPVLDVRRASPELTATLATTLAALAPRAIGTLVDEAAAADRAALDATCLSLALPPAASAALLPSLWSALLASVKLRDRWLLPAVGDNRDHQPGP